MNMLTCVTPETGLICHSLTCNATGVGCTEQFYVNHYCDEASEDAATNANPNLHHCQVQILVVCACTSVYTVGTLVMFCASPCSPGMAQFIL